MSALSGSVRSSVSRLFQRSKCCRLTVRRCKSSIESTAPPDLNLLPLNIPAPSIPTPIYATIPKDEVDTKVTTLKNGLRVASENKFGQFCTVGVIVDSGSRYEVAYPSGISHFLERIAFNSTVEYKSRDDIMMELEKYGGICDCQSSRDTIIYATSVNADGLDPVVKLLAEVVLRPQFLEKEMTDTKTMIQYELEDTALKPEQEPLLTEMIHAAAYSDNTLGLPKLCPAENISVMNSKMLFTYLKNHYTPERMVVAGVGVDHDTLVEYANRHFVEKPALWEEKPELCLPQGMPVDLSLSQYTGGLVRVEKDLSNVSLGPTPIPELAHIVLGLESSSHQDPDFIAFCVLNMLMGGGGSFSAGGPGKGMYTRLYTNVLNRFHWMYNATAYNHAYNDSGVFCIHASAHPSQLKDLVEVIVKEFVCMAGHIEQSELERAKTQLQSMLLMNLESRPVVFEDIARQVLATGHRKPPHYFLQAIGSINVNDLHRAALRLLRTKPAVAALGNLKKLPPIADIESGLTAPEGRMPRKLSLFRSVSP